MKLLHRVALSIAVLLVAGFATTTFADLNVKAGFNFPMRAGEEVS